MTCKHEFVRAYSFYQDNYYVVMCDNEGCELDSDSNPDALIDYINALENQLEQARKSINIWKFVASVARSIIMQQPELYDWEFVRAFYALRQYKEEQSNDL